jgi:hypothetical protein
VPGRTIAIAPLALSVGAVDTGGTAAIPVRASARIDGQALATAAGAVTPAGGGSLAITLAGLRLADYAGLAGPLPVKLRAGTLGLNGTVALGTDPRYTGGLSLAGLDIADAAGNDLVGWQRLTVSGITASRRALAITDMLFDAVVSHVIVSPAREMNLVQLAEAGDTPPPRADAAGRMIAAPISDAAGSIGQLVPTRINTVRFRRSSIAFDDLSHQPRFAARIDGFEGRITGLDSRPGTQANFDLAGYVIDRFSPVSISGKANVFAYDAATDIKASFRNIELPVFNPYSGRYAGFAIARGKLTTDFHYRIDKRALNADHHVRIDQLQWGEATDSKEKVSLPVRLAASLLKDKDGVIDLDLPVGGTLDDPSFRIWPLVWKVVGNVLTKVITAPFRLIGSLFGGGEDPQLIAFAPGQATLDPAAADALARIAKGFAGREDVNLEIPAGAGLRTDAEAIARTALEQAVLVPRPGKPPLAADYAALSEDRRHDRLKAVYKRKLGKNPTFPDGKEDRAARIAQMESELAASFAPATAALAQLGQARASAIRNALLGEAGVPAERLFLSTALEPTEKDDKVIVELKVK